MNAQAVWQGRARSRAPNYINRHGSTTAAGLLCGLLQRWRSRARGCLGDLGRIPERSRPPRERRCAPNARLLTFSRGRDERSEVAHKAICNARKVIDVQMSGVTFTGSDPIAILGFLTQFRNACNHNGVSEGKAVWLSQHYLAGRALNLIQSRMTGTFLVVDDGGHKEALSTYCEVVNYLLRTFATNELIATA